MELGLEKTATSIKVNLSMVLEMVKEYGPQGEKISGTFVNHTVNGAAVWEWPQMGDRVRMEGLFKRGHAHGPGVMYYGDGTRFEGTFKKGYPNGLGKLIGHGNGTVLWSGSLVDGW